MYCADRLQSVGSYLNTSCSPVHVVDQIICYSLHQPTRNVAIIATGLSKTLDARSQARHLSAESIRLKMKALASHCPQTKPVAERRQTSRHDPSMRDMHVPERNDPRATSVLFPCAAFRNRVVPGGVLILLREVSWEMTHYALS